MNSVSIFSTLGRRDKKHPQCSAQSPLLLRLTKLVWQCVRHDMLSVSQITMNLLKRRKKWTNYDLLLTTCVPTYACWRSRALAKANAQKLQGKPLQWLKCTLSQRYKCLTHNTSNGNAILCLWHPYSHPTGMINNFMEHTCTTPTPNS